MSPRERVETVALLKSIRAGRTLVVIDHDMDAIFELAERITVLSQGQILVEGDARGDQDQRRRPGSLSRRGARGMSLLEVSGLNSYYGDLHILFDVGLRVEKNEVVALLGRNGAGKTTTLKSLMGMVRPRARLDSPRRRGAVGQGAARDRAGGGAARARGAAHFRLAQRRGEHRAREPDRAEAVAARAASTTSFHGSPSVAAAAAPTSRAASSRCWRSPARWCAIRRSFCSTSPSKASPRSSCAIS